MALVFLLAFLGGGNVYEGRVIRVIDGDTIRVAIGIWPDEEVTAIRVRGVDTPELKSKCPEERARAKGQGVHCRISSGRLHRHS